MFFPIVFNLKLSYQIIFQIVTHHFFSQNSNVFLCILLNKPILEEISYFECIFFFNVWVLLLQPFYFTSHLSGYLRLSTIAANQFLKQHAHVCVFVYVRAYIYEYACFPFGYFFFIYVFLASLIL